MSYIIVKHAGVDWSFYYSEDPKAGAHRSYSCHNTFTGKNLDIKPEYESLEEAEQDCARLNQYNPCGDYAVCSVKQESLI
jgi:hypothetical protein